MSYEVLARKYRPQTFADLTGQEHVSRTIQNAIDTNRVAHAFLFTGARGVGKTSTARILAKVLNCEQKDSPLEPCNQCKHCIEITEGNSTDVFEIDGASNTSVDDVRELRDNSRYMPSHSRYKIYIIDEVHMLSKSAFNALLKILEEPPGHVKFILATTEPHKLPITILSRCQRLDFKRVPLAKIVSRLREIAAQEGIEITDTALNLVARKGDGSMRDSITCFDQVLAFCGNNVVDEDVSTLVGVVDRRLLAEVSRAVFERDTQAALHCVRQVDNAGYGIREFTRELIEHFRNLLIICSVSKPEEILDLAESELDDLKQQAAGQAVEDIQRQLTLVIKAEASMPHASFPRLLLEMALIKMSSLQPIVPIGQLMEQVRQLANRTDWTAAPVRQIATPSPVRGEQVAPASQAIKAPTPLPSAVKTVPEPTTDQSDSIQPTMQHKQPSTGSWEGLVEFCKSHNKPLLSSLLENGVPLRYQSDLVEVGFEPDSYELSSMQDKDNRLDLEHLASSYMGQPVRIRISAVNPESGIETPGSLAEKKRLAAEQLEEELRREVHEHPLVQEALRVFEGEITEIRPLVKAEP